MSRWNRRWRGRVNNPCIKDLDPMEKLARKGSIDLNPRKIHIDVIMLLQFTEKELPKSLRNELSWQTDLPLLSSQLAEAMDWNLEPSDDPDDQPDPGEVRAMRELEQAYSSRRENWFNKEPKKLESFSINLYKADDDQGATLLDGAWHDVNASDDDDSKTKKRASFKMKFTPHYGFPVSDLLSAEDKKDLEGKHTIQEWRQIRRRIAKRIRGILIKGPRRSLSKCTRLQYYDDHVNLMQELSQIIRTVESIRRPVTGKLKEFRANLKFLTKIPPYETILSHMEDAVTDLDQAAENVKELKKSMGRYYTEEETQPVVVEETEPQDVVPSETTPAMEHAAVTVPVTELNTSVEEVKHEETGQ